MPNWSIPNLSNGSQGIESLLAAENTQLTGVTAGLLFFIWLAILGFGYFAQERRTGAGNLPMWAAISGLITTTGAFILFLYDLTNTGIVLLNIEELLICVVVTIVSAFLFFVGERD